MTTLIIVDGDCLDAFQTSLNELHLTEAQFDGGIWNNPIFIFNEDASICDTLIIHTEKKLDNASFTYTILPIPTHSSRLYIVVMDGEYAAHFDKALEKTNIAPLTLENAIWDNPVYIFNADPTVPLAQAQTSLEQEDANASLTHTQLIIEPQGIASKPTTSTALSLNSLS